MAAPSQLTQLVLFIGLDARDAAIDEAVNFSEFNNMKKMEAEDAFGSSILRARNATDPDSFKVREGSVGGYVKHFGEADLRYLDEQMKLLDPFFGYVRG
jgi:hypothetical protein